MTAASTPDEVKAQLDQFRADFEALRREVGKVIVGLSDIVDDTLTALIAGGHVLLEGVPGLGKTLLVRTLADCSSLKFQRIQFTPDLMPADLIGTNVMLETPEGGRRFEFQRGPIFANLLLADEINRATPKTQSALLEAMQERSVTVAGTTHRLAPPFFVLATQNPLEMEGTYPLPEAQLDRFFFKLLVKFPSAAELETILDRTTEAVEPHAQPIFDGQRIVELSQPGPADPDRRRPAALWRRPDPGHPPGKRSRQRQDAPVRPLRIEPARAQAMILAAKIRAILDHRYHVSRDDLRACAASGLAAPPDPQLRRPGRERSGRRDHRRHPARSVEASAAAGSSRREPLYSNAILFDSDFLKKLEYLSLVSRRVFRGQLLAQRRTMQLRRRASSSPTIANTRPATTSATSTGTCSPATTSSCSSGSRKRKTCTSTSCSIVRGAWPLASRSSLTMPGRSRRRWRYIALADLDRVSVVAFAGDIVADFPLTRGKARILSLLKFLEGLEPQGSVTDLGRVGAQLRPPRPAPGAGRGHQRPVRSRRFRARARPAAAPPL